MKNIILFLLFIISLNTYCQDCVIRFNNQIKDIVKINNSEFVFISDNFKITKVDSNFDTIWHNDNLNFTNFSLNKIQPTLDGGFIGCGGNLGPFLFKLDNYGDTVWTKECELLGPGPGSANIVDIIQTADSGFAFTATYGMMSLFAMVAKTNSLGDTLWTNKNILYPSTASMYNNQIKDINETNNGDIVVSGYINENSFINPPEDYSYIFKYNSSGDSIWAKTFNNLVFNSLKIDDNNDMIIASQTLNNSAISGSKIIKVNSIGDTMWTKHNPADMLNTVNLNLVDGYIFGGSKASINNNYYLIKTDQNGDSLWSRQYEEDTLDVEIKRIVNSSNGYLLLGSTLSSLPFLSHYLDARIKVDSLGYCFDANNTGELKNKYLPISIYPNPTENEVKIIGFEKSIKIELFDILGNKLISSNKEILSLINYPKGIYILNVNSGSRFEQFKIIKE